MMTTDTISANDQNRRSGYTLIELLVAIGIIAILASLILPAVQSAREAARRATCGNNLRQIGLALASYESQYQCFPPGVTHGYNSDGSIVYFGLYSPFTRILQFMERGSLYSSINFDVGAISNVNFGTYVPSHRKHLYEINLTSSNVSIGELLCPSDSIAFGKAGCNYRANTGVGYAYAVSHEHPDSGNGIFPEASAGTPAALIPDGLSHTVAMSERVRGSGSEIRSDPTRDAYKLHHFFVGTADNLITACKSEARERNEHFGSSGHSWFWLGRERTHYCHAQVPDGVVPDCIWAGGLNTGGMVTARSNHPGGVNSLFADGSVRFIKRSLSQDVWRAIGTKDGSELVD